MPSFAIPGANRLTHLPNESRHGWRAKAATRMGHRLPRDNSIVSHGHGGRRSDTGFGIDASSRVVGGEGGIRTHDTLARIPVFETGPFNHSGTSPKSGLPLLLPGNRSRFWLRPPFRLNLRQHRRLAYAATSRHNNITSLRYVTTHYVGVLWLRPPFRLNLRQHRRLAYAATSRPLKWLHRRCAGQTMSACCRDRPIQPLWHLSRVKARFYQCALCAPSRP